MRLSVAFAAVLLFAACKEDNLVGPPVACVADDLVTLTVATNPTPRFTWNPTCLAFRLGVTDSIGNYMWEIEADSGNTLVSGITYGVVPGNATETIPAVALTSGQLYAVGLFRKVGPPPPDSVALIQAVSFRR